MKVVLLNDCSDSRHFGSKLVTEAYRKHFAKRDVELLGTFHKKQPYNRAMLERADLVIVNGEGTIHDHKFGNLLTIGTKYPAVLMNCTVESTEIWPGDLQAFQHIAARETRTQDYLRGRGATIDVVPDVIFSHTSRLAALGPPEPVGNDIFLSDSSTRILSTCRTPITTEVKDTNYIKLMAMRKWVCAGRFHAICGAAMLDRPFSAYRANTWKNEALMEDMGVPELYYSKVEDAIKNVPTVSSESVRLYVDRAQEQIDRWFDRILK